MLLYPECSQRPDDIVSQQLPLLFTLRAKIVQGIPAPQVLGILYSLLHTAFIGPDIYRGQTSLCQFITAAQAGAWARACSCSLGLVCRCVLELRYAH